MYNFLVNATKQRLILELKDALSKHPIYKDLEVYNRFPYNERIQEGIIVKNSSATRMPLSADNFQGNVFSYISFANHKNNPGTSLEWAKEDEAHLSTWLYKQDFSNNLSNAYPTPGTSNAPLYTKITLFDYMVKGGKDLSYANDPRDVEVYVNNNRIVPVLVDGFKKEIIIPIQPILNPKVEVSYWARNLAPPGVYQIEITEGDPEIGNFFFMVDCLLEKQDVLSECASGTETSFRISSYPIYPKSLRLKENDVIMTEGIDYYLDEATGIITLTSTSTPQGPITVLKNSRIVAEYRVTGLSTGPFEILKWNCSNNQAIPGVVLAFGRGLAKGDKHYIVIQKERRQSALEFSGKWEMTISLDVYAKDTIKIEEVIDMVTTYLNTYRKSVLDAEGIALVDVSFGGESEQVFDEGNNDQFYMGSVDYNFLTEWIMHQPLLQTIEGFIINSNYLAAPQPYIPNRNFNFERIK